MAAPFSAPFPAPFSMCYVPMFIPSELLKQMQQQPATPASPASDDAIAALSSEDVERFFNTFGDDDDDDGDDDDSDDGIVVPDIEDLRRFTRCFVSMQNSGQSCAICHDPMQQYQIIRQLPCLHAFHQGCVDQSFERNALCPLCRQTVLRVGSVPPFGAIPGEFLEAPPAPHGEPSSVN